MTTSLANTMNYPEQLEHIKSNMGVLAKAQPETINGFSALHSASTKPGALNSKTKELIALAIAVADRCDGCIAFHTHDALNAGATREEIIEALGVAVLMGGGPSVMYASHVLDAIAQFQTT